MDNSEIRKSRRGYLNEDFQIFHLMDQKSMEFEFHYHEFNKINILISGNAAYMVEGKTYNLKPWDVLFINSNEIHKVCVDADKPYERIIIWVNSSFLNKHNMNGNDLLTCFNLAESHKNNLLRLKYDQLDIVKRLLQEIEGTYNENEFGKEVLRNSLFLQLMVHLNRMFLKKDKSNLEDIDYDESINEILEHINRYLSEELSIDKIAERFFMSKYHLMHKFKKQTGYTIHNYIIKKRLIMANNLIKRGIQITEVCSECGFDDYSNFLRAYKKMFGISPKKYYLEARGEEQKSYYTD